MVRNEHYQNNGNTNYHFNTNNLGNFPHISFNGNIMQKQNSKYIRLTKIITFLSIKEPFVSPGTVEKH